MDAFPRDIEFFGGNLGEGGQNPLPHFDFLDIEDDFIVGINGKPHRRTHLRGTTTEWLFRTFDSIRDGQAQFGQTNRPAEGEYAGSTEPNQQATAGNSPAFGGIVAHDVASFLSVAAWAIAWRMR